MEFVPFAGVRVTRHPQHKIEVNGLRLRYIDVAPSREAINKPLLMIHGHTSRIEEYEEMVGVLSQQRRVLVVDLPGCGYSDKPDRPYTLRFYEDTLLGFLDALGIGAVDLAGGSLGGNLVLRLGAREADRFSHLAAWAPAGVWQPARISAALMRILGGRLLFWPMLRIQSRYWYAQTWPGRQAALRESFMYYKQVVERGFIRMYWDIAVDQMLQSLFPLAQKIMQPVFLGWGDKDNGLGMAAGVRQLKSLLPRSELKIFSGARHSLAQEVPVELASAVDEFLLRRI
jgi:pimeloyl-ACP methyl ester carboxylesterase